MDLDRKYNTARSAFIGMVIHTCSLCGKGVRQMKQHLKRNHSITPTSEAYKMALGAAPEHVRSKSTSLRAKLKEKQSRKNTVPVSLKDWVKFECRGGLNIDSAGMTRSIKLIFRILKENSLSFMNLVDYSSTVSAYEVIYESLKALKYKHSSINVILGYLKKFIKWSEADSQMDCSSRSKQEHAYYMRLCRRKAAPEIIERKNNEYLPSREEMLPIMNATKHQHIVQGMLVSPRETLVEYGVDIVHATIAWPLMKNCGVRTGVIRNMLTKEVLEDAVTFDEGIIIKVKNHKTSEQYGAYRVTVTSMEYKLLCNYINNREIKSDYVFCTKKGTQSSYSNISRFMKVLFSMYGLDKLSTGTMRKFITTLVHKGGNEISIEATASLLKHSAKTARRDYKAMQNDRDALKASKAISDLLGPMAEELELQQPGEQVESMVCLENSDEVQQQSEEEKEDVGVTNQLPNADILEMNDVMEGSGGMVEATDDIMVIEGVYTTTDGCNERDDNNNDNDITDIGALEVKNTSSAPPISKEVAIDVANGDGGPLAICVDNNENITQVQTAPPMDEAATTEVMCVANGDGVMSSRTSDSMTIYEDVNNNNNITTQVQTHKEAATEVMSVANDEGETSSHTNNDPVMVTVYAPETNNTLDVQSRIIITDPVIHVKLENVEDEEVINVEVMDTLKNTNHHHSKLDKKRAQKERVDPEKEEEEEEEEEDKEEDKEEEDKEEEEEEEVKNNTTKSRSTRSGFKWAPRAATGKGRGRRFFEDDHVALIRDVFHKNIREGNLPERKEIRSMLDTQLRAVKDHGYYETVLETKIRESCRAAIRTLKKQKSRRVATPNRK